MRPFTRLLLILLAFCLPAAAQTASSPADVTGHWEGQIDAPGTVLEIVVDLASNGDGWSGDIDIPIQGLRDFSLNQITVDSTGVSFAMPGIPGDPVFRGTLSEDGAVMQGHLHQGGMKIPFELKRDLKPVDAEARYPDREGISGKALELLADRVQRMVDDEEIVGGELVVIKNRQPIFREAYGWLDREADRPLEIGAVYCVRSMTKPFVGTAVQMLIDEGRLDLATPVREILPFFDQPEVQDITVAHLMTHTAGFPFTTLTKPLADYANLGEVAAEAAASGVGFAPGTDFEYSDAGSDTLGAIVAQVTGMPVEKFIQKRILDPLGMRDTVVLLGNNDAVKARIPSAYSGGTGAWSKHWEPTNPPMFPIFLTSQSLYSTTTDYARFLALWMDGGMAGEQRLLSEAAVERGLKPFQTLEGYPQGLGDLNTYYGQQWMVYANSVESPRPVVFGHGGSDGTHAWAWPELDLMVLFFTQSRGTLAGVGLERMLQTVLVDQNLDDPALKNRIPSAQELAEVAGLYWDEDVAHAYYVVKPNGNRLTVERPGRMYETFKASATPGRFVHEMNSQVWIEFVRSQEGGVEAMRTSFGNRIELDPRHVPQEDLPTVESVIEMVQQAHAMDRLEDAGGVRMVGTINMETRQMSGTVETLFDATRERTNVRLGGNEEIVVKVDGRATSHVTTIGKTELEGARLEQALLDRVPVRFGDWTQYYEHVEVLKRAVLGDDQVLLVRVVPKEAPGATIFVHEETGWVVHTSSLAQIPGLGMVGVHVTNEDFRDVDGMRLPFRTVAKFSNQLIGRVVTQLETVETGVEANAESFALP